MRTAHGVRWNSDLVQFVVPGLPSVAEDRHQRRLDRDAAFLAALAADMDDRTVVAAADVTDVSTQQFIGAQPGEQ